MTCRALSPPPAASPRGAARTRWWPATDVHAIPDDSLLSCKLRSAASPTVRGTTFLPLLQSGQWPFRYSPALSPAGIDRRVRIHDLRHAHASWLLSGGADLQWSRNASATAASARPSGTSTPCRTLTRPHSMPSLRCVIDEARDEQARGCMTPSAAYCK